MASACAADRDEDLRTGSDSPATVPETGADSTEQPDAEPQLANVAEPVPYQWRWTIDVPPNDFGIEPVVLEGGYDPATRTGTARVALLNMIRALRPWDTAGVDPMAHAEGVYIDGVWFFRGLLPELGHPSGTDPTVWYETDSLMEGGDTLFLLPSFDELENELAQAAAGVTDIEPTGDNVRAFAVRVEDGEEDLLGRTIFAKNNDPTPVDIVVEGNSDGQITRFVARLNDRDDSTTPNVEIEFWDFGIPIDIPEVAEPQALPTEEPEAPPASTELTDLDVRPAQ